MGCDESCGTRLISAGVEIGMIEMEFKLSIRIEKDKMKEKVRQQKKVKV
jgi:hypothetical protein